MGRRSPPSKDPDGLEGVPRPDAVLRAGPAPLSDDVMQRPQILDRPRDLDPGRLRQDPRRSGQGDSELADRIVTTSPDVTGTTNLGPWVNRRKLFARRAQADTSSSSASLDAKWEFTPDGQHIELGIAEMNLFLLLGAAGLSHSLFGKRLIPIGTVYDPFVARGLDALNYACYQDARFMIVGTPSGVTLAPEGGAHQSIGSPLIGMSQDGLAASSRPLPTNWP
jgi:pyruvate dehydrogenase E1 component